METLLYFYSARTPFVIRDEQILSASYKLHTFSFATKKKWHLPFLLLGQLVFMLWHFGRTRKMVSQFSGYHTFLPSFFNKWLDWKHIIILHGTECNNFPELRYGYLIRPVLFWFSRFSLLHASKLLPVSEALVSARYTYFPTKYEQQGFRAFYKNLRTPYAVIYNGVSPEEFKLISSAHRNPKSIISVASGINDSNRQKIKGIDLVLELAAICPDYVFTLVGYDDPDNRGLPANISTLPFLPPDQLCALYNDHQFYMQLSMSEGFGISLVEGMMCGCVPIVSDVGIMPKIAGPFGYTLEHKDVKTLKELLNRISSTEKFPPPVDIRKWAVDQYAMSLRQDKLLTEISNV